MTQAQTQEKSPREILGLNMASEGNPVGASIFVDFVQRELFTMTHLSNPNLPEPVKIRLNDLQRHAERVVEFIGGFNAARAKPDIGT